jgi:protein involved in polysaccharide export with SLBB domain
MPTIPSLRRHLRVALLGALFLGACRLPAVPEHIGLPVTAVPEPRPLPLGPNDMVRIGVFGHPELSTTVTPDGRGTRIDSEGNVQVPLVGPVHLDGLLPSEARVAVQDALAEVLVDEPVVDLAVVEYASRRFYVYGEVQKPGAYAIDRTLNAYQGLALGGGFTRTARRDDVLLVRAVEGGVEVIRLDGESPSAGGLVTLQPDDLLFVRRSGPGKFSDEVLPILSGLSSSLGSVATILLIEDRLKNN